MPVKNSCFGCISLRKVAISIGIVHLIGCVTIITRFSFLLDSGVFAISILFISSINLLTLIFYLWGTICRRNQLLIPHLVFQLLVIISYIFLFNYFLICSEKYLPVMSPELNYLMVNLKVDMVMMILIFLIIFLFLVYMWIEALRYFKELQHDQANNCLFYLYKM